MRPAICIIAGIWTCSTAFPQQGSVPTFGTTVVVPGGLLGVVYHIPPWSTSLPYFQALDPLGVIYTSSLNVPPRNFQEGFPGVTDRFEWFAIDYTGRFWIEKPGVYQFALTSDDGAKLYIDDEVTVDNDGIHPPQIRMGRVALNGGIHRIRVSYFQGPRTEVALVLQVAGPGEELRVFSTDEFRPPPNPETWRYRDFEHNIVSAIARVDLRVSPAIAAPGDQVTLGVSLQSQPGKEPVDLAWDLVVPTEVLELIGDGPETSHALKDSGRLVKCSVQKSYLYTCKLVGDPEPIRSGPIATFDFKTRNSVPFRAATLRLENVEAAATGGRHVTLNDAEKTVAIH